MATRDQDLEAMLTQPPPEDDLGVQHFLDGFAKALVAGDDAAIAEMWESPAFVLGAGLAHVIDSPDEAGEFFGAAREQYNALGVVDTRAEIVRVDEISDQLVMVRVHWPYLDAQGRDVGAECATYTLAREEDGDWKVRIAVLHGREALN